MNLSAVPLQVAELRTPFVLSLSPLGPARSGCLLALIFHVPKATDRLNKGRRIVYQGQRGFSHRGNPLRPNPGRKTEQPKRQKARCVLFHLAPFQASRQSINSTIGSPPQVWTDSNPANKTSFPIIILLAKYPRFQPIVTMNNLRSEICRPRRVCEFFRNVHLCRQHMMDCLPGGLRRQTN